jgi:hypothetical protein
VGEGDGQEQDPVKKHGRGCFIAVGLLAAVAVVLCGAVALAGPFGTAPSKGSIRNGLLYPFVPERDRSIRFHPLDFSTPVAHVPIPQHPFMAANAGNNMHNDAYMSDTYEAGGPLGANPQVRSRTQGFGGYGTVAVDRTGRLVGVYSNGRGFQLELMDPYTLRELAALDLPPRPWYFLLQGIMPWEYIGAGMYFYLDNLDRAVVPTTANTIQVIQVPDLERRAGFDLVREYDLAGHVVPMAWPKQDSVAWVLPDWGGDYYWYATTGGMVGTIDIDTGEVHSQRLEGEIVENSFAVAEDGVYIISDRALYRFTQDGTGQIVTKWRTEYDRGPKKKPGLITRGSGTSVTLLGQAPGYVAVTDNAEPRIHLLFVSRADGVVVCSSPVLPEGKSATDITVIGFEHAGPDGEGAGVYSAIVENNWGHNAFPFANPEPGIARIDLTQQADGSFHCEQVWSSAEKNLGVFKLSLGNGLLYLYFGEGSPLNMKWYFAALDLATGETVFRQLVGTGLGYNNWAGSIFLHPDGGIAYSTTIFGLVMIQDTVR